MLKNNFTLGQLLLLTLLLLGCDQPHEIPPPVEPLQFMTPQSADGENIAIVPEILAKTVIATQTAETALSVTQIETVAAPPSVTPTIEAEAQVSDDRLAVSVRHGVPNAWRTALAAVPAVELVESGASVELVVNEGTPVTEAVYALVVPLYSFVETASWEMVQARWQADAPQLAGSTETLTAISQILGQSGAGVLVIDDAAALAERVWAADDVWGIVPLGDLSAELKTLPIDGQSPLKRTTDLASYPLALPIGAVGDPEAVAKLQTVMPSVALEWQPDKLTDVAMTGVTALVRATAYTMEENGILWPGEDVRGVLNSADIAHLSNEVAFVDDCPTPRLVGGTRFCSNPRYFALVQDLGIDVMELTGNHVNDYGAEAFAASIKLYQASGMKYFGGGLNSADAQTAAIFEHNGNRIVFLGCNPVGPSYALAGDSSAGSRPCDDAIKRQIREKSAEGATVIVTLQYYEHYFYEPTYQQQLDFRSYIDAGASIVSGSQGHHVQGLDLYSGGFIHYGLGNLFFDQMDMLGTRQTMIDTYTIYKGKLAGVTFTTGLIERYARPRLMSAEERRQLFETLFNVSTR
ncbi:MAG: CapA family protein [Candidatus Promineifilaceae bacterium]